MKETVQILKEQVQHFNKITRIARYDQRATYQSHYLGMLWEVLSPTLQVLIYYFVFGIRMNGASSMDAGVPYIVWMLAGMIPWFFISAIIISGANSIYSNLSVVSRVKFPMSILPSITIFKSLYSYATMLVILLGFLFINHLFPTIYWTQFFLLLRVYVLIPIRHFSSKCDDYDPISRLPIDHWLGDAPSIFHLRCSYRCHGQPRLPYD